MGWKENIEGLNSEQVDEIWQENKKINFYHSLKVWEKQLMTWLELMIYDWGGRWWFVWLDKSSVQECWSIVGHIKEIKGGRVIYVNAVCSAILRALNIGLAWFSRVRCCHEWMRTLVLQSIRAGGCYWSRSRRPRLAWRGANLLLEPFSKRSNKNWQLKQYVDNM